MWIIRIERIMENGQPTNQFRIEATQGSDAQFLLQSTEFPKLLDKWEGATVRSKRVTPVKGSPLEWIMEIETETTT